MSAPGPLGATPRSGTVELGAQALEPTAHLRGAGVLDAHLARPLPARRRILSRRNLGLVGIAGLLTSVLLVSLAAAHSNSLLPESVQPIPSWLAGPFGSAGLHLGSAAVITLFALMFGAYVLTVHGADRLGPRVVLMAIAALHALVLLAPPLLSTDVFSYQAYARIAVVYHANPYLQGPHAIALDPLYPFIGAKWVTTPSAYGPLFTVFSLLTAHMTIAASALTYKALAAVASLATAVLVWNAARLRGLHPERAAALVALNPLVVVWGVGGGHNDLPMVALLAASIYAALAHRDRAAGALPVLAGAVKLTGLVFLPFVLLAERGLDAGRRRRGVMIGAGAAVAAMAALGLGMFGGGQLHLFSTLQQTQSEGDWHSIPGFISTTLGLGTVGHVAGVCLGVVFVGVFVWLLVQVQRGRLDWIDGAGWAAIALVVTAGSMLPWYVAWLMPFAALATDRRLGRAALTITGIVVAIQLIGFLPHSASLSGL